MDFFSKNRTIERLDSLIRRKSTGSPKELAHRIEQSERNVYRIIDEMRLMGFPIEYCKVRNSYYYTHDVKLTPFNFTIIDPDGSNKIKGGKNFFHFFEK